MMTYTQIAEETRLSHETVVKALATVRPTVTHGLRYYARDLALKAIADYILAGRGRKTPVKPARRAQRK